MLLLAATIGFFGSIIALFVYVFRLENHSATMLACTRAMQEDMITMRRRFDTMARAVHEYHGAMVADHQRLDDHQELTNTNVGQVAELGAKQVELLATICLALDAAATRRNGTHR
jgi:hypothetical protein